MVERRQVELGELVKKASVGNIPVETPLQKSEALETLSTLGINLWSSDQVSRMRNIIEGRKIGPETRYFQAYAFARAELKERNGTILLKTPIPHEKQQWSLSCEANSMRDIVNYYRL